MTSTDNQPCREALLPCPFCGGSQIEIYHPDGKFQFKQEVHCARCGANFQFKDLPNDSGLELCIKNWNTRALMVCHICAGIQGDVLKHFCGDKFREVESRTPPISYEAVVDDLKFISCEALKYEGDYKSEAKQALARIVFAANHALAAMGTSGGK